MKTSQRLDRLPPYLSPSSSGRSPRRRRQGVDVISPRHRRPRHADAPARGRRAAAGRGATPAPTSTRRTAGARSCATRSRASTSGASAWRSTPTPRSSRRSGPRSASSTSTSPSSTPATRALAADPGYPVYTGGPLLAGAEAVLVPLLPGARLRPRSRAISAADRERARLLYLNYPNNPTGAVVPDGLFERGGGLRARARPAGGARRLVHRDDLRRLPGAELPRDAGASEVGVEVFSLSKGWNMTGWRTAASSATPRRSRRTGG